MSRISSGIKEIDSLIGGGFNEKSINLIAGGAGSGKTIFAFQFLIEGLKKGENCLYLTFEEKKEKVYENMLEFGWDLKKYEKKGEFVFLEYTPEQIKAVIEEGGGIIEQIVEKNKIKRIAIDSITSFTLLYQDPLTKKEASLALFELINNWNCTALLTAQNISADQDEISAALEFEVDSIIILYHTKVKGIRKRALEILKMRGTKIPEKTIKFEITDKGIKVYPKEIVKV